MDHSSEEINLEQDGEFLEFYRIEIGKNVRFGPANNLGIFNPVGDSVML